MDFVKCPGCKRPILKNVRRCPACNAPLGAAEEVARGGRRGRGRAFAFLLLGALSAAVLAAYVQGLVPTFEVSPPPKPQLAAAPPVPEDKKFGLTEAQRRDVYSDILRAEDHAQVEADRRYPPPDPNAPGDRWQRYAETREQFRKQADEEDKKAIAKRYGLTPEQLVAVSTEGVQQNWPRPPSRSFR